MLLHQKNAHATFRSPAALASPHGGKLVQLMAATDARQEMMREAAELASLQISAASTAHLAMLACGAFSPLDRFVGRREYQSIVQTMRLTTGELCPVPVTLPAGDLHEIKEGSRIALRDVQNRLLAILAVEEIFDTLRTEQPRRIRVNKHSAAGETRYERTLSGALQILHIPTDLQFPDMWRTPSNIREELLQADRHNVIAVDSWDPSDGEQIEWLRDLAGRQNAFLLLNLADAEQRADTLDHFQRLHTCKRNWSREFSAEEALLNLVHLETEPRTEKQILWHAIVHKNYGANHYAIDLSCRRHNGDTSSDEMVFPDESDFLHAAATELGIKLIFCNPSRNSHRISLASGAPFAMSSQSAPVPLPLRQAALSSPITLHVRSEWGLCLWFTGLPCSGKSTVAEQLLISLMEGGLRVTLLDGDTVRTHLSKGLSFSREDRDTNVQRIGFVASEIVRHRGVVVCAAVSPYRETRERVRQMMPESSFVEIFIDTPLEECERRDVKGFYAKARAGQLSHFTGVNDPYEAPYQPEMLLYTEHITPKENAQDVMRFLIHEGYLDATSEARTDAVESRKANFIGSGGH
jgi:sulfate adenylyltransferase